MARGGRDTERQGEPGRNRENGRLREEDEG